MVQGSLLYSTVSNIFPMPSYSKAPRGLFVQVQVGRIFTAISISPGNDSRQSLTRSAFRAGRNLPDKEFRYHRTVHIVIKTIDYVSLYRYKGRTISCPISHRTQAYSL